MPITRAALQRYRIIDELISKRPFRYPSLEQLFEACQEKYGIRSKSTTEKDLYCLRYELEAPIKYDRGHNGYYYEDPNFKLLGVLLTHEELQAMNFAEKILQRMESIPFINDYSNAVEKLQSGLSKIKEVKETITQENFIEIDRSYKGESSRYLPLIVQAITERKKITFNYQKYDSYKAKDYELHPMKLKEVHTQWYLIGYDEEAEQEKTFGLNRINNLNILKEPINIPEQIISKVQTLFEHIYGITMQEGNIEEIILSFSPIRGKYVQSQPIHKTQKELPNDGTAYIVSLKLIPNRDLITLLLSFGEDLEIIQPYSLRTKFKELLLRTLSKYS